MAVRSTMSTLIAAMRDLINDPAGSAQVWQDQQMQDKLDENRFDVKEMILAVKPVFAPGGLFLYEDFYANQQYWEDDVTLYNTSYNVITPLVSENFAGHWQFSTTLLLPVRCSGKFYDLYGAAADTLEMWAARLALAYDFATDAQSFKRSQQSNALLKLADQYRRKSLPRVAKLVRNDLTGTTSQEMVPIGYNDVTY